MVKVEPIEPLDLEQIKTRLQDLKQLVKDLKSDAVVRAKSLEMIQQERVFLQQQLTLLKTELDQARGQNLPVTSEPRVLN